MIGHRRAFRQFYVKSDGTIFCLKVIYQNKIETLHRIYIVQKIPEGNRVVVKLKVTYFQRMHF